jgi:DNA-binding transcriptional regulator LsrR (DeoR family)
MLPQIIDFETERLISRILTMYYIEEQNQAEIGLTLGISAAKVNRLLKQARNSGWVEFIIRTPSQHLFDLEHAIQKATGVKNAIIVPRFTDYPETMLAAIGQVAADYLLEQLRDGDIICNGGGRGVAALVKAVDTTSRYDVQVVPALGGVQGNFDTDVNSLTAELAKRLGGVSYQLYAPAFSDTREEQQAISASRHVKEVLDLACRAQVAVVGVGSISPLHSSIRQFTSLPADELQRITDLEMGAGEILARIIDRSGSPCAQEYAERVIGIRLEDLRRIPLTIGIAALDQKASAVAAALKGNYLKTIIMDDVTAREVLTFF